MPFVSNKHEVREWVIYKITSPSGRVYIGITSNFKNRMEAYRNCDKRLSRQTLVYNSIRKHGYSSHTINQIDIFKGDNLFAQGKEMFWIRTHMSNKNKYPECNGLNLTDGGDGTIGYKATPEAIEKNRQSKLGKKQSPEVVAKRAAAMRGKKINTAYLTPEYRKRVGDRIRGFKHTPEALKKISEASKRSNKGKVLSEATKQKLREANLGKKYSEETKRKLSEARKGVPTGYKWTDEQKKAMSEKKILLAYRHTDEAKAKIAAASTGNKFNLGRKQSDETIAKRVKHLIGNKFNLGRKLSEEHKKSISEGNKGRIVSEDTRNKIRAAQENREGKPICQYDLCGNFLQEFTSIRKAERLTKIARATIKNQLEGITLNPKTFIFKYKI